MSDLKLLDSDAKFLSEKGYQYDLFAAGDEVHIVLKNFPLPQQHYKPANVDLLLKIPAGYPNTPMDMFWMNPDVALLNGQIPDKTEARENSHGREWQRWSRHYVIPWRPGVDDLRSFVQSIHSELRRGV